MPLQKVGDVQMTHRQRLVLVSSEFFWNIVPGWLARLSPALGVISQDGRYLSGLPVLGNFLALFGMLVGVAFGLMDRGGLPYTANFGMLALLLVLGILSGQAGFWAFCGFVTADAIGLVRMNSASLSLGYAGAVLISWFLLFQLVAGLPLATRLMGGLRGRWAFLNGLVAAIFASGFTELWTRLSMIALRPLFTWRGREPALELVNFIEPGNDWTVGLLSLHKLAWLALAAGLCRWILTPLVSSFSAPLSVAGRYDTPPSARKVPWWLTAFGKAASVTAIIAGVFTTIAGAFFFCLSIQGAVTLRTFASANRIVALWDGWMFRIPAAIRLIASYALCFYLAEAMIALFRDTLAWRTMTTAAAATASVFAVSLLLWPQVSPGEDAPAPPKALQRLLRGTGEAVPCIAVLLLMFSASTAFAHHCSFQPGCECLLDKGALAALIAAAASLALLSALNLDPTKALEYFKVATSLAQHFLRRTDAIPDANPADGKAAAEPPSAVTDQRETAGEVELTAVAQAEAEREALAKAEARKQVLREMRDKIWGVIEDSNFHEKDGKTYCNQAAVRILEELGVGDSSLDLVRGRNANDIFDSLDQAWKAKQEDDSLHPGLELLTGEQAQQRANDGHAVIATFRENGTSGHVAIVAPVLGYTDADQSELLVEYPYAPDKDPETGEPLPYDPVKGPYVGGAGVNHSNYGTGFHYAADVFWDYDADRATNKYIRVIGNDEFSERLKYYQLR